MRCLFLIWFLNCLDQLLPSQVPQLLQDKVSNQSSEPADSVTESEAGDDSEEEEEESNSDDDSNSDTENKPANSRPRDESPSARKVSLTSVRTCTIDTLLSLLVVL